MDLSVIRSYVPLYREALRLTLAIGWMGVAGATAIGLAVALVLRRRVPVASQVCRAYVAVFRNTPLLVQLFFMYFGLPRLGLAVSADACGALGLSLLGGAYMAETFRSGLEAVPSSQARAALALGLTRHQAETLVVLPQAAAVVWPSFVANVVFLLKETSVFSAISLMDLMFCAKDLIGLYYRTEEALILLVVFYLAMLLPVSLAGSVVERRLSHGGARP